MSKDIVGFLSIFSDVTRKVKKIPKNEYLVEGKHIIIDQGKNEIAGYTNNEEKIFRDVPAVVFGDHTRVFKYVEKPFFIGADGVKVLIDKKRKNTKYYYYQLLNAKILDTGYNRHYKWVKELQLKIVCPDEQEKIVKILDTSQTLIDNRKKQIKALDELIESKFYEMFGDPEIKGVQKQAWDNIYHTKTGKLDANAMVKDGKYPFFTCSKNIYKIDNYAFESEALLLAGNNATGDYDVKYYNGKFNAYQRTYVITLKKEGVYIFHKYLLEKKLKYLQNASKGSNTKYITLKILQSLEFITPSLKKQKEFEQKYTQVTNQKTILESSLQALETQNQALMQKYFK